MKMFNPVLSLSRKLVLSSVLTLSALSGVVACGNNPAAEYDSNRFAAGLRPLSQKERAEDFDQLLSLFKSYYGPYEYKEKLLKINIEKEALRLKELAVNAKTEEEFAGYVNQFGALLKDGHISLSVTNSQSGIARYSIPIFVETVENKIIVSDADEALSKEFGISDGDEILEVDDKKATDYLALITKYEGYANSSSEKQGIFFLFLRRSYMTDLIPKTTSAKIKFVNAEDVTRVVEIPWTVRKYNSGHDKIHRPATSTLFNLYYKNADEMNSVISSSMMVGDTNPFFMSAAAKRKYGFIPLYPSDESRKKAGLTDPKEKPPIFAGLYKHNDKNILLVRIATFSPSDFKTASYMKAYKALLTEFQAIADVLVLDQTHNPGGSYCSEFYELFAKELDVSTVQRCNADRKWINLFAVNLPAMHNLAELPWKAQQAQAMAVEVETAYDKGQRLSSPLPIFTGNKNVNPENSVWTKPMLVLVDEYAGSCGDILPMLVKANKRAYLFGEKTMGLGGNVELIGALNNSNIQVKMTRGLFTSYKPDGDYKVTDFVENNGVEPNIKYSHTVKDVRSGYINYIKTFSDAAVKQIPEKPALKPESN